MTRAARTVSAMTSRIVAILLTLGGLPAYAGPADPPVKYELRLIHVFDGKEPEHIFVVGDSGFRTVESLKRFLGTLPPGSEIRWAPGCERFPNEPLLSSEKDMEDFKAFLREKGISFVLVPSG